MSGASGSAAAEQIISFTEIPYTWKVPGEYMEVKPALNANAILPFPAYGLVIGQMQASGSAQAGAAYQIYSTAQARGLFGQTSIVAEMCDAWLAANPYTPLDAMGVMDATGATAATGGIAIAGTATEAGTLVAYLGGVRVQCGVAQGDTAETVAENLYAAIEAQSGAGSSPMVILGATYTSGGTEVVLTAQNAGTLGNQIDIRLNAQSGEVTPAGLTVTIEAMAGGATDPYATVETVLAGLSKWYTDVAFPWTDSANLANVIAWATTSYGAMVKKDVQVYCSVSATYGTLLAFAPNSQFVSPIGFQNPLTPSWRSGAAMAGACCYSTANQPALQMKTVVLPGVVAPASADQFTLAERELLLVAGISTWYADSTGAVYLERVTTSRRTDPGTGAQDFTYFDLQSTKVPTRVRYDWNEYISEVYPRNLLAPDGSIAAIYSPDVVTPRSLLASWTGRSAVYEQNGWIQNSAVTAKASTFTIDPSDGSRVNARQQIQIMGNLIVLAGSLEFISNN
jgi:phage tail sheath gpL-like